MAKNVQSNDSKLSRVAVYSRMAGQILAITATSYVLADNVVGKVTAMKMEMVLKAMVAGFFIPVIKKVGDIVSDSDLLGYIYPEHGPEVTQETLQALTKDANNAAELAKGDGWVASLTSETDDQQHAIA